MNWSSEMGGVESADGASYVLGDRDSGLGEQFRMPTVCWELDRAVLRNSPRKRTANSASQVQQLPSEGDEDWVSLRGGGR